MCKPGGQKMHWQMDHEPKWGQLQRVFTKNKRNKWRLIFNLSSGHILPKFRNIVLLVTQVNPVNILHFCVSSDSVDHNLSDTSKKCCHYGENVKTASHYCEDYERVSESANCTLFVTKWTYSSELTLYLNCMVANIANSVTKIGSVPIIGLLYLGWNFKHLIEADWDDSDSSCEGKRFRGSDKHAWLIST